MDEYPHQFSGGMRQRVVIALALCTEPELIIADEPTTALDVSVQKQILALIRTLCTERNIGIILITHDIGVINEITDRVTVLRSGRVIETGPTAEVLGNPVDEYTKALMAAVPHDASQTILSVADLAVTFHSGQPGWFGKKAGFKALSNISFDMQQGQVLGVVGESGSGKSTLAKAIVGLVDPSAGEIFYQGQVLPPGSVRARSHPARRQIQMVFQDPYSSLNNRRTVEQIIAEPIRFYNLATERQAVRQRIAVARALVARPEFLICDEPTSALDVSIQAQMLNLLKDLQQAFGLSILFISHNLAVIRQMADSVVVLKNGCLVEVAETEQFFHAPAEPYSRCAF